MIMMMKEGIGRCGARTRCAARCAAGMALGFELPRSRSLGAEDGMDECGDILTILRPIEHHAFEDIDDIVIDVVEFLDDWAVIP